MASRTFSWKVSAVMATMGTEAALPGRERMARVASMPSMTGMRISMKIMEISPSRTVAMRSTATRPFSARSQRM